VNQSIGAEDRFDNNYTKSKPGGLVARDDRDVGEGQGAFARSGTLSSWVCLRADDAREKGAGSVRAVVVLTRRISHHWITARHQRAPAFKRQDFDGGGERDRTAIAGVIDNNRGRARKACETPRSERRPNNRYGVAGLATACIREACLALAFVSLRLSRPEASFGIQRRQAAALHI